MRWSLFLTLAVVGGADLEAQTPPRRTPSRPPADTTRRPQPRPAPTPQRRPAAPTQAVRRAPPPPPPEKNFGAFAGGSLATLKFGVGPSVGATWRYRRAPWPIALRGEAMASFFQQSPSLGGVALGETATLAHFGAGAGVEYPLGVPRATAPYLIATGGVYRFSASGPSGEAGGMVDGEFASTTDVALGVGAGVRFMKRFSLEARILTVGDFHMVPITLGLRF